MSAKEGDTQVAIGRLTKHFRNELLCGDVRIGLKGKGQDREESEILVLTKMHTFLTFHCLKASRLATIVDFSPAPPETKLKLLNVI
jgi:hypothetical protein